MSSSLTLLLTFYAATVLGILVVPLVVCLFLFLLCLYCLCNKYFADDDVYAYLIRNYEIQRNANRNEFAHSREVLTSKHSTPTKRGNEPRSPPTPILILKAEESTTHDRMRFYY